jgi:hypothetical protein
MISPLFEKFVIFAGGALCLAGLAYLYMKFPAQALFYIGAAVAGTVVVGGLITYFTRSPA